MSANFVRHSLGVGLNEIHRVLASVSASEDICLGRGNSRRYEQTSFCTHNVDAQFAGEGSVRKNFYSLKTRN
jgi:predicted trehalose synthase